MGMTSLLDRVAGRSLDATFGGRVLVQPRLSEDIYGPPLPDPLRADQEILGHFATSPRTIETRGSVIGTEVRGGTRLGAPGQTAVVFTAEQYARLTYELAVGDLLKFLDEPGEPVFVVAKDPHRQGQDVDILLAYQERSP